MKSLIKMGGLVVLFALLVCSAFVGLLVVNAFAQEEQSDSTRLKRGWEQVKIEVKTDGEYEYLKSIGVECPQSGECEIVINQWQSMQIRKKGIKLEPQRKLGLDEGPNQLEYKLVKEVDLKADEVDAISFGPKKDKGSALSEIILGAKGENICIYDSNFTLINKIHLSNVTFSKNLRYLGGKKYVENPSVYDDTLPLHNEENVENIKRIYKFELFDYTGKKLWELERGCYEIGPNSYSISNKGTVIERDHENGVVTFFDQNGNEIKKIKVCNSSGTPGEGIGGGIFSDDGEYALIIADDGCPDTLEERVRVLFFTWDGKELWRATTEENGGGERIFLNMAILL